MGYSIGVSKNQMARLEAGGSIMTQQYASTFNDQVEKYLIRENLSGIPSGNMRSIF